MNLPMEDKEKFCFEASFLFLPYSPPHWHPSQTSTTSDTTPSAASVVKGVWIYLGTYEQVPK